MAEEVNRSYLFRRRQWQTFLLPSNVQSCGKLLKPDAIPAITHVLRYELFEHFMLYLLF